MTKYKIRSFDNYQAYIVDVDGTLYFKRPMQVRMLLRLLGYYTVHFLRVKELFILRDYRKLRDQDELSDRADIEQIITKKLSDKYRYSIERVQQVTTDWMLRRPLDTLYMCRDKRLLAFLESAVNHGKTVYVYSDYPAVDKCKVLGIRANEIYWPDGKRISVMKPAVNGLQHIIESNGLDKRQVLFIGDRMSKDGVCALRAGVDFLILKKQRLVRWLQYQRILTGRN